MTDKNENIVIFPSRKRLDLNDKETKILFNQDSKEFLELINGTTKGGIIEKRKHGKKGGKVISGYTLTTLSGFTFIAPLDEYDRDVLNVFVTEYENGAEYITLAAVQRALSGKNCESDKVSRINKNQDTRLKQAIDKLMACQYDPEIMDAYTELNYEGAESVEKASILPCERLKKRIGGKVIEVIHLLGQSPLHKLASIKKQILTYDADLLDVPNQNNTPLVIMLKNYTLRRVLECINHKLTPTLTFDDIFKKCRISDAHLEVKRRAREYLEKFFAHLQDKKVIKSSGFTKKGRTFYSIKFTY